MDLQELELWGWSEKELPAAVSALARRAGIVTEQSKHSVASSPAAAEASAIIAWQAQVLGCETQPILTSFQNLARELAVAYPALLKMAPNCFWAVLKVRGKKVHILTRTGSVQIVALQTVCNVLCAPLEAASRKEYEKLLQTAAVPRSKQDRMVRALLYAQGEGQRFQDGWLLRGSLSAGTSRLLQQAYIFRNGIGLVAAHVCEYLVWLAAWGILGRLSFEGQMDRGRLWLWALLLLTLVPIRVFTTWAQGVLAIGAGALLKRRLLLGALRLQPEEIRHQGSGSFLGQAFEAGAVESLALNGGVMSVLACLEIMIAAYLLGPISIALAGWCIVLGLFGWRLLRQYQRWTSTRMKMTQELVENMIGHRTRLVQQERTEWHRSESADLDLYLQQSQSTDFGGTWLVAFLPRGWLITGLLCLASSVLSPHHSNTGLAIRLGGVLLAFTAFKKLTSAAVSVVATIVAGKRILPLFRAAERVESSSHLPPEAASSKAHTKVVEADQVTFRYRKEGSPAVRPSSVTIYKGERILLEGVSGGGKTTFASLLSGMRQPESGLLLLNGIDRHSTGLTRWREKVASAPQFHENHILTETLAFNLLMGRRWPASQSDLKEAESLCYRLGLGDLLERMPGGLMQMVGEGGWQLSQGERSRIYIARALLQKADLVILDESFAALDPQNLQTAVACTLEEAATLVVIAHP